VTTQTWHRIFDVDYNIDKVLVWARKLQLSKPGIPMQNKTSLNTVDLGEDQYYWEGEFPKQEFDIFNDIICLDGKFRGIETSCSLWEYQSHTKLLPHIHDTEELIGGVLIVPLIGNFKTSIYQGDKEIDSVEYSPGKLFFVKGKEFLHGGEAIDGYRLAALLYIKKGVNLDDYII
jgi:hypothetical protein